MDWRGEQQDLNEHGFPDPVILACTKMAEEFAHVTKYDISKFTYGR